MSPNPLGDMIKGTFTHFPGKIKASKEKRGFWGDHCPVTTDIMVTYLVLSWKCWRALEFLLALYVLSFLLSRSRHRPTRFHRQDAETIGVETCHWNPHSKPGKNDQKPGPLVKEDVWARELVLLKGNGGNRDLIGRPRLSASCHVITLIPLWCGRGRQVPIKYKRANDT